MKKRIFLAWILCFSWNAVFAQTGDFRFESGDLLFQDVDCGELCDAIEMVTKSVEGKSFSHVGLVYRDEDSVWVIEASGKDVHLTALAEFLGRSMDGTGRPKVYVGRLKEAYRTLNREAVAFALAARGLPYDEAFLYDNGAYYCSELIYDAYLHANGGTPFFRLEPMTFRNPRTGETFPVWKSYYDRLNMNIPEVEPGCNPGGLSRSERIEIVKRFY